MRPRRSRRRHLSTSSRDFPARTTVKGFVPRLVMALAVLLLGLAAPAAQAISPVDTAPAFNGGVYAIAHVGPVVYLGGSFTSATYRGHSYPRQRLAAFDARTGALLSWAPAADGTVRALAATADSVYAAGDFHAIGRHTRDSLARLSPAGAVLPFRHTLTGTAYALTVGNGRLYLGGSFADVDGEPRANLAAFALTTGDLDEGWRPNTDDAVHALA